MRYLHFVMNLSLFVVAATTGQTAEPDVPAMQLARTAVNNAAVVYWQAFAALPVLTPAEEKVYIDSLASIKPLSDEVKPVVQRFGFALKEMERATTAKACDWELEYSAGPGMLLPHLTKMRDLSRASQLRARLRFQEGNTDGAVADLVNTLKMSRHAAASPVLISYLVGMSIEKSTTELLAAHLPELDRNTLAQLQQQLTELPNTPSIAECMRAEEECFVGWLEFALAPELKQAEDKAPIGPQVVTRLRQLGLLEGTESKDAERFAAAMPTIADLRKGLTRLHECYSQLAEIAEIKSSSERRERALKFERELELSSKGPGGDPARFLSQQLAPAIGRVMERATESEIQRALLQLAVQGQRNGLQSLADAKKPGPGELKHEATEGGFVVKYRESANSAWQSLHVGKSGK